MEDKAVEVLAKAGKPVRSGNIAKELGADSKDVSKALAALKKEGKVILPRLCFYASVR